MLFLFDYFYNYKKYKILANYKKLEYEVMKLDAVEARNHQELEYNRIDFCVFTCSILLLITLFAVAIIIVICKFYYDELKMFEGSILADGLLNPQVTSVFTATIFCAVPMSIDLSMDVFLYIYSLNYQDKCVADDKYLSADFFTRILLITSFLCVPVTVLAVENPNLKCGLYVLMASFQNVFIAGAVYVAASSKKKDPIYNWMFSLFSLFVYGMYQLIDVIDQIGIPVHTVIYTIFTILRICGVLAAISIVVASIYRILYRQRLGLPWLSNDSNGLFHFIPMILGAVTTEIITGILFKDSGGTQATTDKGILIYNQYMALALILILALVPKRVATQIAQEKSAELKTAYDILRGTYSPLKFVKKYLTKLFTIDQLQDANKSRIANYMVLACNRILSRIDNKSESLAASATVADIEEAETKEAIGSYNNNFGALTNQQLERELDMESIASSETYKLEVFENELEFAAARKVVEKQFNL